MRMENESAEYLKGTVDAMVQALREQLPLTPRAQYEVSGELDGCWYCGSFFHKTNDCRIDEMTDEERDIF